MGVVRIAHTGIFVCLILTIGLLLVCRSQLGITGDGIQSFPNFSYHTESSSYANTTCSMKYDRSLPTGLGDRISIYMVVAAIARMTNIKICVYWENIGHRNDRNYSWDKLKKYVKFPSDLVWVKKEEIKGLTIVELTHEGGQLKPCCQFDVVPELAFRTFKYFLDKTTYLKAYRDVSKDFEINLDVESYPFIAVHVRGADKFTDAFVANSMFVLDEIREQCKTLKIVCVSDDEHLSAKMELEMMATTGTKLGDELRDLKYLLNSVGIVQVCPTGWSAYSNLISFLRELPLLNTSPQSDFSGVQKIIAANDGNKISNLYGMDDLDIFLRKIGCKDVNGYLIP